MDQKPKIDQNTVETEAMNNRTWGFDLLLQVAESMTADFSLAPNDTPAKEECGPQQPQTECHTHLGAAPLSLQQPIVPAPGFHAAQTGFPLLPTNYAPAEEKLNPQQSQSQFYMPLGAAPFSLQQPVMPAPRPAPPIFKQPTILQPNYMYYQAAPFHHSQVNNRPVVSLPQGHGTNLVPVGFINGEVIYGIPPPTAPPVTSNVTVLKAHTVRRRNKRPHNESSPYVKKPPNAFMMYRKEQMPNVVKELQNADCALVNQLLGQRWRLMCKEEQEKYYELADKEKQLHSQRFPEWTSRDNYGKKRKRTRIRGMTDNSAM